MCRESKFAPLVLWLALAGCQAVSEAPLPERSETPVGGPERVFARPVAEIVPLLQGARLSGPTGRVGPEMVFWTYELASGRPALLVACAVLPTVDCAARLPQVCAPGSPELLFSAREQGEVRSLTCQEIAIVAPGDLTPNCVDTQAVQAVDLSLLSCR